MTKFNKLKHALLFTFFSTKENILIFKLFFITLLIMGTAFILEVERALFLSQKLFIVQCILSVVYFLLWFIFNKSDFQDWLNNLKTNDSTQN